jgi:hypothetical protein
MKMTTWVQFIQFKGLSQENTPAGWDKIGSKHTKIFHSNDLQLVYEVVRDNKLKQEQLKWETLTSRPLLCTMLP